jgi:hypothetical protein
MQNATHADLRAQQRGVPPLISNRSTNPVIANMSAV